MAMPTGPDTAPAHEAPRTDGRPRRRVVLIAAVVAVPTLALILWWFQPQALLFDQVVDESFPGDVDAAPLDDVEAVAADDDATSATADDPAADDPAADQEDASGDDAADEPVATGPIELASGSFVSRNRYTVTGTATAFELDDGQRILRLEDFESTNGPDLFVYLTVAGADDHDAALDTEFVDLGTLTGNIGDQNYVIPDDVDLDRYDSVVIWCRRFTSSFGVADLA
jgi:hypothetical protein